jgi:hypothetical protein
MYRLGTRLQGFRRGLVCPRAERIGALSFKQVRHFLQTRRKLCIAERQYLLRVFSRE